MYVKISSRTAGRCSGTDSLQAPDGTRADKEGKRWYPPSGNGILAASQGYYPKKGSVSTGDLTTNIEEGIKISAPDEGEKVPGVGPVESKDGETKTKEDGDIAASKCSHYQPTSDVNNLANL